MIYHTQCLFSYNPKDIITRRFDILPDGNNMPMDDFASLVGMNEQVSGTQFKFTLVVSNYIYANGDAHLKNFSLI